MSSNRTACLKPRILILLFIYLALDFNSRVMATGLCISALSGGWGCRGRGNLDCIREARRDFPLPLHQQCRSLAAVGLSRRRSGCGNSELHVTTNVEMVADEVFCWAAEQWRLAVASRGYEFYRPTRDV